MRKSKPKKAAPAETPKAIMKRFEKEIIKSGNDPKTVAAIMLARRVMNEHFRDVRGTCADVAIDRMEQSASFRITLPGGMSYQIRVTPDYHDEAPF